MADTERLAQYQTLQENHLGFKGILSGIAEEIIPEGFVPDMENLRISTEGLVEAVSTPNEIAAPTSTIASAATSMFTWFLDNGTSKLLAQYGRRVFAWNGSTWTELRNSGIKLGEAITSTSATTITVDVAHIVASGFTIKIDDEIMNVTAGGTGTSWTVVRGYEGSTAATHDNAKDVYVEALNSTDVASFTGGMGTKMYFVNRATQVMEYDGSSIKKALTPTTNGASVSHAPMGDFITIWKNRLFVGGKIKCYGITTSASGTPDTTDYFYGVCWSNINMFDEKFLETSDHYDGGFPVDGLSEFRTQENSQITGLLAVEESLFVFLESAIFRFSGYSNDTFNAMDLYHGANTPNANAFVRAGGIYYVSDDGIYAYAEVPQKISKNIETFIDTKSGVQSCAYWDDRLWFCTNGKLVAMNMKTGNWEKFNITGQTKVYASDNLYISLSTGIIAYFSHTETNSGFLDWYIETPVHNQGITTADKRYKSIFVYHKALADAIVVKIYPNYSATPLYISPDITSDTSGEYFHDVAEAGALIWGSGLWSEITSDMEITLRYVYLPPTRTIKIHFSGTGDVGLLGYAIVYKPKRKQGVR